MLDQQCTLLNYTPFTCCPPSKEGRQNPEKLQTHQARDLVAFVKECQWKGKWILLVGDLNEVLGVEDLGLTSLYSEWHACLERPASPSFQLINEGPQLLITC